MNVNNSRNGNIAFNAVFFIERVIEVLLDKMQSREKPLNNEAPPLPPIKKSAHKYLNMFSFDGESKQRTVQICSNHLIVI